MSRRRVSQSLRLLVEAAGKKYPAPKFSRRADGSYYVVNAPRSLSKTKAERFHWEAAGVEAAIKTYNDAKKKGESHEALSRLAMDVAWAAERAGKEASTAAQKRKYKFLDEDWTDIQLKHDRKVADEREAGRRKKEQEKRSAAKAKVASLDLAGELISRLRSRVPGIGRGVVDEKFGVYISYPSRAAMSVTLSGAAEGMNTMGLVNVFLDGDKDPALHRKLKGYRHRADTDAFTGEAKQVYTIADMNVTPDTFVGWAEDKILAAHRALKSTVLGESLVRALAHLREGVVQLARARARGSSKRRPSPKAIDKAILAHMRARRGQSTVIGAIKADFDAATIEQRLPQSFWKLPTQTIQASLRRLEKNGRITSAPPEMKRGRGKNVDLWIQSVGGPELIYTLT